jgi:hypothetical protein
MFFLASVVAVLSRVGATRRFAATLATNMTAAETIMSNQTLPKQQQAMPGTTREMKPVPDHGEKSYRGSGRLAGKRVIITGGDSGIGRAVAIAYAREGADLLISYLCEDEDAEETARWVEQAGRWRHPGTCALSQNR